MTYLYSVITFAILALAYSICYKSNNSTPIPNGCEVESSNCGGCNNLLCSHHEGHSYQKGGE